MTKKLIDITFLSALAVSAWFGLIEGVEGAKNITLFILWMFVPLFLLGAVGALKDKSAAPPKHWLRHVTRSISAAILWMVVWSGHVALGSALAFSVIVLALAIKASKQ